MLLAGTQMSYAHEIHNFNSNMAIMRTFKVGVIIETLNLQQWKLCDKEYFKIFLILLKQFMFECG
jgi:hypothetical protein